MTLKKEVEYLKRLRQVDLELFKRALDVSRRARSTRGIRVIIEGLFPGLGYIPSEFLK